MTSNARPAAAVLAVVVLWGAIPAVLKHFSTQLDPPTLIGLRYTLSGLVFVPLLLRALSRGRLPKATLRAALIPAAAYFAGQVLWTTAPYFNSASIVMFIGRTSFLVSILFGFVFLHEERAMRFHRRFFLGTFLTVGGLAVLFVTSQEDGSSTPLGFVIMLLTAFFWGIQGVLIKTMMSRVSAPTGFGLISVYCVPAALAVLFLFGDPFALFRLSAFNLALLVFSSVISIGVGQVLTFYAFQRLGPVTVEGSYQSIPFMSAAVAAVWLGERMTPLQWLAGGVIVFGSLTLLSIRTFSAKRIHPRRNPISPRLGDAAQEPETEVLES